MATSDENEDPREVAWHPRFAAEVIGHGDATLLFKAAFDSGRPHHAWLLIGQQGIGKATLAYSLARYVLGKTMAPEQVKRWVQARAHPDLVVLERTLNDSKPKKLKSEISVDNARAFIDFFGRTSGGGGWRVGLVDAADDLNNESANALLKLVEEPPVKCLILLVCHSPGRLLRTLRSRCRKLPLAGLTALETTEVLKAMPLEPKPSAEVIHNTVAIANGRPGFALQLMNSEGAKAFQAFVQAKRLDAASRQKVIAHFASRLTVNDDFAVFTTLLQEWLGGEAKRSLSSELAALHSDLAKQLSIVAGYNLDRRTAVMDVLVRVDHALKVA
jgi:DNA polymerase-3 subunit delta'